VVSDFQRGTDGADESEGMPMTLNPEGRERCLQVVNG